MKDIHGLANELLALESETFEIDDYQGGDMLEVAGGSTTSTTSTCSTCSS